MQLRTIEWLPDNESGLVPGRVRMIDQTRLPNELVYLETAELCKIWDAIKTLKVRGAPAIGVAAAMGVAAGVQHAQTESAAELLECLEETASYLATSRPTAVNLFWALDRMRNTALAAAALPVRELKERLAAEACAIRDEDEATCRAIGEHGLALLSEGRTILTHCNAGSLATARYGTALAPAYLAHERGMTIHVFADETRPLLQGARLTTWELMQAGIDVTLICDNTAAQVMREGRIDAVFIGADRIAANGDAANKIGSYGVALLARAHKIPFYVLAPTSTIDADLPNGEAIPIENREPSEITEGFGRRTAPPNVQVYAPAFDVTPAEFITAIVCEHGIAYPPFRPAIAAFLAQGLPRTPNQHANG